MSIPRRLHSTHNGNFYKPTTISNIIKKDYIYFKLDQLIKNNYYVALMSDVRNFVLRDEDGNEYGVFAGKRHSSRFENC